MTSDPSFSTAQSVRIGRDNRIDDFGCSRRNERKIAFLPNNLTRILVLQLTTSVTTSIDAEDTRHHIVSTRTVSSRFAEIRV